MIQRIRDINSDAQSESYGHVISRKSYPDSKSIRDKSKLTNSQIWSDHARFPFTRLVPVTRKV